MKKLSTSIAVPFIAARAAMAAESVEAVQVGAKEYIGESTFEIIAHAFDPLVDLMVALSFPIASVEIIGSSLWLGKAKGLRLEFKMQV